jgi:hypothetical protein
LGLAEDIAQTVKILQEALNTQNEESKGEIA